MHKINPGASKRTEFERDERRERERTQKKHEKMMKKETFFFNRLGGHGVGKKNKFGGHVVPTKKPQSREKKLKNSWGVP
jgi:hypothetical protein